MFIFIIIICIIKVIFNISIVVFLLVLISTGPPCSAVSGGCSTAALSVRVSRLQVHLPSAAEAC